MNEIISQFHFIRPQWFWALLPALLISALCWKQLRASEGWKKVIAPELLPFLLDGDNGAVKRSPAMAIFLSWIIAITALAGPSWQKQNLPVHQRLDALVIVMDLSLSMYADDIKPSRITRARHKLLDILALRDEGVTALVAYAGDSHIVTPLTDDKATIANLIPALAPAIMALPGSNPVDAIETAISLFESATIDRGRILLVSDSISKTDIAAISKLMSNGSYQLSILGVGTTEGAPIPLGNGELLKGPQGEIIIPKLTNSLFEQLASKTNGQYRVISWDDSDTRSLFKTGMGEELKDTITTDKRAAQWRDSGYWLVLLLLPVSLLLFRRGWLLAALPLILMPVDQAFAVEWQDLWYSKDQQGARAMQAGQTDKAAELFVNERWHAAAQYKAEKYKQASEAFAAGQQASDHYNRGNALAKQGDYEGAKTAYDKALNLDPTMADALFNKKLIEEIEKQQQNSSQESPQDTENESEQQNQQQNQQSQNQQNPEASSDKNEQNSKRSDTDPQDQTQKQQQSPSADNPEKDNKAEQEQSAQQQEKSEQSEQQDAEKKASEDEQEKQQATEQWLRRVPDDPSGLLRRKFEYESKQQQRTNDGNKIYW